MDIFTRNRSFIFVIILLVVLNLGMLLVFWLGCPENASFTRNEQRPEQDQGRIERLLKDELGFDQAQIDEYLAIRRQHQERMKELRDDMQKLKEQMFDDVLKDESSPALNDSLLALTQQKQAVIERLTFQHLLDLKKLCKPGQQNKLQVLIRELFRNPPRKDGDRPPRPDPDDRPPRPPSRPR